MVVDHTGSLHESVANRSAHKFESPLLEGFAHGIRFGCAGRNFGYGLIVMVDGLIAGKLPDKPVERTKLRDHTQKSSGVGYGGAYFGLVTYDGSVLHQLPDFTFGVRCNFHGIKLIKRPAEILPLVEHCSPAQPCLEGIEHHEFKQLAVVVQRNTPFGVVIGFHQRIVGVPRTICYFYCFFY